MATVANLAYPEKIDKPLDAFNFTITPSDSVDLQYPIDGIIVGTAGNIVYQDLYGTQKTAAVPVGLSRIRARRVLSTSTTASGLTGVVSKDLR